MPLSMRLHTVQMSYPCPHCQTVLVREGRWYRSRPSFTCTGCQSEVRLSYADKIALFARYEAEDEK